MKQWYRTLAAKTVCFILCVFSVVTAVLSVFGAVVLINLNFYTVTEQHMLKSELYSVFLNDSYRIINFDFMAEYKDFNSKPNEFSEDNTNLRFQIFDPDGNIVSKNIKSVLASNSPKWQYSLFFEVEESEGEFDITGMTSSEKSSDADEIYTLRAYLEPNLPIGDEYALVTDIIDIAYSLRYAVYPIGAGALILAVACFIILMCVCARKSGSDALYPGPLNRVPIDLLTAVVVFLFLVCWIFIFEYLSSWFLGVAMILLFVFSVNLLLGMCISISARIKQKTLLTNTVIWLCCKLIWNLLKWLAGKLRKAAGCAAVLLLNVPLVWRTVLIVLGVSFLEFVAIAGFWYDPHGGLVFWVFEKAILIPVIIYSAIFLRKLQKGGEALAKGDLSYKVDTGIMFWDFKRHGENLNSISDGMSAAVEDRLKSERMKAELITNVSHDIKTPLTSIINYAGLIGETHCDSVDHNQYSEVLVRKSKHLKRLLDDLVEVSKASSGNMTVSLSECEAGVLMTQASGEFEQRCREAGLELVTSQPKDPVKIMADSRKIWRVFENLMSNACKYSLAGSRVYLDLKAENGNAVFIFRNTSRTALTVSPNELTERFVRGDTARTTEGNGLGLSIAKSLTELQNGQMDIAIDGDLFKVTLKFPLYESVNA